MDGALEEIDRVFSEIALARKRLARYKSRQITQTDLIDYLKAVAHSWFRSHRPPLIGTLPITVVSLVDSQFQRILDATIKASAKTTYVSAFKEAKEALVILRGNILDKPIPANSFSESPPDFSSLAADSVMRDILVRRWEECQRCLRIEAHLAATVMMGGFLEALFIAKANKMNDKAPLFKSVAAPKDYKTKKPLPLSEWTLRPYIEAGEELGWISRSGKEIAAVLRDYRNYIHPDKERSHGVKLNTHDSEMFWQLTRSLTQQLLK